MIKNFTKKTKQFLSFKSQSNLAKLASDSSFLIERSNDTSYRNRKKFTRFTLIFNSKELEK